MKRIVFIIGTLLISSIVLAQSGNISKGDEAFENDMYELAAEYYEKAIPQLKTEEEKIVINYKLGICYFELAQFDKAESRFTNAFSIQQYSGSQSSQISSTDIMLRYAESLRMSGKYEVAIGIYSAYLSNQPNDPRAINGREACFNAPKWMNRPTRYEVLNMAEFNSNKLDFSPVWASKDYRELYFTTSRDGTIGDRDNYKSGQKFTDLFAVSQDRKGSWTQPIPLEGGINSEHDEGAAALSSKGSEIFFTRCLAGKKVDEPCKIYYSTKRGNMWSTPIQVSIAGFEKAEVGYPSLNKRGDKIVFSSNKAGGLGGMDLYIADANTKNGTITNPRNLGYNINTLGNEVFPYIRENDFLYFASDGWGGMGGLDIYMSEPDGYGGYNEPENLKYPINSSYDDFGIIFKGTSEEGYFTSNRPGGKGGDDIYSFTLPPLRISVEGYVKDTTFPQRVLKIKDAKITLLDEDAIVSTASTDDTGAFSFDLEVNHNYTVKAEVDEDYFANSTSFSTKGIEYDTIIRVEFSLARIPVIIELPNIEYEYDKADLKPESTVALDGLVKTLTDNPHITIELRAHTDFRGVDDYNMELSLARAKSCVDYLILKGIEPERLTAKGFGESMPKEVNENDAKRYNFLKVGDVLTEEYINKLKTKEQTEAAHQLNRRTEFSVLSKDFGIDKLDDPLEEYEQQKGNAEVGKDNSGDF
ncbi:MAG TPA: OmpA family protein [Bacteroidales bacterium]|nr:OmpA family protein [Bacteroidales bacterium]